MNKCWFFIFILTASLSCSQSNPDELIKSNVVIILADYLGIADVEAFNPDSKIPTPGMNMLAEEGMRFVKVTKLAIFGNHLLKPMCQIL